MIGELRRMTIRYGFRLLIDSSFSILLYSESIVGKGSVVPTLS
jgi:hypothetical protein